jgi:hypothetical protein
VNKAVTQHRRCLQPVPAPPTSTEPAPPAEPTPVQGRRAVRTRTRHAEVQALREQGLGVYVIARRLGLDPKTVRRYADAPDPEALIGPNGTARDSILDRFKPYLQQRCAEGVTATNQLLAEIRARGFGGGERTLRRWLIGIRGHRPVRARAATGAAGPRHHRLDHASGRQTHRRRPRRTAAALRPVPRPSRHP